MAAVIRLLAKCAHEYDPASARKLLSLLNELRAHPALSRRSVVLAGLAEAHATWLHRIGLIAEMQAGEDISATDTDGEQAYRIH